MASARIAREMVYAVGGQWGGRSAKVERRLTWAETGALDDGLCLFGLETGVQLEAFDVAVQFLGRRRNLRIRVPLQERRIRYIDSISP